MIGPPQMPRIVFKAMSAANSPGTECLVLLPYHRTSFLFLPSNIDFILILSLLISVGVTKQQFFPGDDLFCSSTGVRDIYEYTVGPLE